MQTIFRTKKEVRCLYETGVKDLILASFTEGTEFLRLSLIRSWFRQGANIFRWIKIEPILQICNWYPHF
jgi:hypothetical protein